MSSDTPAQVTFKYNFKMGDSRSIIFEVQLSADRFDYQAISPAEKPHWTNLEFHMCEGCKLADMSVQQCPVAVNLQDIVTTFKSEVSYDVIDLSIETAERT